MPEHFEMETIGESIPYGSPFSNPDVYPNVTVCKKHWAECKARMRELEDRVAELELALLKKAAFKEIKNILAKAAIDLCKEMRENDA